MKNYLLSFWLMIVLSIVIIPSHVLANEVGSDSALTTKYGNFIDGDHVISDMIKQNGMNAHPRIIMSEDKFDKLKSHIGDGSVTAILLEELRGEADRHLRESVATYDAYGEDHLLETSKRIQRRVAALAMAYNIFGDEKYAERCYKELKAACDFPDWSPKHFLDTAEMCTAFAYGYDWLYNWMTPEQRTLLRTNLIKKGLNQVMEDYTDTPSNRNRTYKWYQDQEGDNWQLVCTGGTDLAALAIGDEADAKEIASEVLTYGYKRAYSFVRRAYSTTDGTYIEGLGYWDYATYYLGLQSSALISATGTDYGLADYEGVKKSVDFVRYMSSNTPKSFSFGDDRESRDTGWAVFLWLGEHLNSPELSAIRLKKIDVDPEFNYLDVLWIDESKQGALGKDNATDWGAVGACNASFRNTWDESGLVTALHVGENNYKYHGHYDLGSFYIESNGSRFFTDLGNENYSLTNRQFSYRIKPEGHNTLVINPTTGTDQREGANCLITSYASGNEAYAVTDLTDAYGPNGAESVIRGLKMIKDKECVVVQDEISLEAPGEIYWFAHTKGSIDVAADGKTAIVTVDSDRLWVGLISEDGEFTVMKAEPLSTSLKVSGATSNSEYKKLAIHLTNTKETTISVACIPLKDGEMVPAWIPSLKATSEWAQKAEIKHDFSKYVPLGNGKHKVVCKDCDEILEGHNQDACFGGTATCKEKAICIACGQEYGSLAEHKYGTTWSKNATNHWKVCSVCSEKASIAAHVDMNKDEKCDKCYYNMHQHVGILVNQVNATCTKAGVKAYYKCSCGRYYSDAACTKTIPDLASWKAADGKIAMKAHTLKTTTTKATTVADGKKTTKCSVCGKVTKTSKINKIQSVQLAKTTYIYDGKVKKPTVVVKDSQGNTIAATNYSITYSTGRKNVGTYTVKLTFKGDYSGKTNLSFVIRPKATTIKSLVATKKSLTIKWVKQTKQVDGYEIWCATNEKFSGEVKKVKVSKNTTGSKKFSKLEAKQTYYVKLRTYKKVGTKKLYSNWTKVEKVKTK